MAETKVNQPKKVTDWKNLVKLYIPQKFCYLLWSSMANRKNNFTENWKKSVTLPPWQKQHAKSQGSKNPSPSNAIPIFLRCYTSPKTNIAPENTPSQ